MKIVDAKWEERNLNVTCFELHLDAKDNFEIIKEKYYGLEKKQYMVIRIPSSRYDLTDFFQKENYRFIESAITLEHNLKEINIPQRLLRICDKCTWERMDKIETVQLRNEIYKNIFKTDRIYIDPMFTKRQAAQRYDFWIKDLINTGNIPYKVSYAGDIVGFFLNKEANSNIFEGLLAATYSAYERSGMGYCVQYAGIKSAIERGANKYIGHVSANNPEVLKVLLSIGFAIKTIEYIFIKHNKGEEKNDRAGKD